MSAEEWTKQEWTKQEWTKLWTKLKLLVRRPKSALAAAFLARIVLGCARGMNNAQVAATLHITAATVCK